MVFLLKEKLAKKSKCKNDYGRLNSIILGKSHRKNFFIIIDGAARMFCRKEKKGYIRRMHLIDQYFELLLLGDRPLNCFETTGHPSNHLDKGSEERVERQHQRDNHRVIPVMSYPMDGLDIVRGQSADIFFKMGFVNIGFLKMCPQSF